MTYSKITQDQFNEMQFDAGVWVRDFDITRPTISPDEVICATSGGISLSVVPNIVDTGSDVYMMPKETAEMLLLTGWTVDASFVSLGFSAEAIRFALGAADNDGSINPRLELQDEDFDSLWWIGDRVDGGLVAIRILNALSDEGLGIQTEQGKAGQVTIHVAAHGSLEDDMYAIPVEIYSIENRPMFDIIENMYLVVYNADGDIFEVDEETGELYITENGVWSYSLNTETGTMEVSKR